AGSCTVTATASDYTRSCQITCARTRSLNNTMGNVGSKSSTSLDGTTKKSKITEIYFLNSLSDAPSDAKDLSADGGGGVLCWTEGSTQYIAGEGGVTAGSSCSRLFWEYENLTAIHFSGNFDTSNVKSMAQMFIYCYKLTSLDISDWDTSSVTDMTAMFNQCYALNGLDLSGWDVSNVTSLYATFLSCNSLTSLDVSNWDTSRVTDMGALFMQCRLLTSLDLSGWDTSRVTNMFETFRECTSLRYLDLSGWDTSGVEDMGNMFMNCYALEDFDPWVLDTSHADTTDMYIGTDWEWISN
ncbi:MAG: BspA family leucine-rich repeat surface protein, partial [Clostridiales bacterium]|nr:BspA family leucine-rich repeat surface protein [Clostridiales bacterium]